MHNENKSKVELREEMHIIGTYWRENDTLPETAAWDILAEYAHELHDELDEQIHAHAKGTMLTVSEAEVWVLANNGFSKAAIALVMTADVGRFETAAQRNDITHTEVDEMLLRTEQKIQEAEQLAKVITEQADEREIDDPQVVVLEGQTYDRLRSMSKPGEQCVNAVVRRHCDELET